MKNFSTLFLSLVLITWNTAMQSQVLVDSLSLESYGSNANFYGLDADNGTFYLGKDFDGQIIQIDPDGTELSTFASPYDFCHGLAITDSGFYLAEDFSSSGAGLFEIDLDGNEVNSWVFPDGILGTSGGVGGIDKVGDAVWFTVYFDDSDVYPYAYAYLWVPGTAGFLDTVPMNGGQPHGIEQVGNTLFYVIDDNDDDLERLYSYDLAQETDLGFVDLPDTQNDNDQSPRGLVYSEGHLYLMADRAGPSAFPFNMLYKYEVDVEVVSVGEEHELAPQVLIAPNPVVDEIRFINGQDVDLERPIWLLDAMGREVQRVMSTKDIQVDRLPAGRYHLVLSIAGEIKVLDFIKE